MTEPEKKTQQWMETLRVFLEAEVRRLLHENKVTYPQLCKTMEILPVGVEVLLAPQMSIEKSLSIAAAFGWPLFLTMNRPITLTCMCCGHVATFTGSEEAFEAGWDCPPHFTGPITCDLCPTALVLMPDSRIAIRHRAKHEEWKKFGRPGELTAAACGLSNEPSKD